jgi:hypothetical protein
MVNLSDYQISTFANSTQVGLHKLKFSAMANDYLGRAIKDIFEQYQKAKEASIKIPMPEARIPYTLFPEIRKPLKGYDKKHETGFVVLNYKNQPVGIIKESNPASFPVCPECGMMVKKQIVPHEYKWWQKVIRIFFRGAWEKPKEYEFICPTHKKVESPGVATV